MEDQLAPQIFVMKLVNYEKNVCKERQAIHSHLFLKNNECARIIPTVAGYSVMGDLIITNFVFNFVYIQSFF